MALFDHYHEDAHKIHQKFRTQREQVKQDKNLSPEGKRAALERLDAQRKQEVATLASNSYDIANGRRVTLQRNMRQEAERRLEARRKLLGDALVADQYRRELEALDSQEIVEKYQGVQTEWEKEVISGYAMPILSTRLRAGDQEAHKAFRTMSEAAAQNEPEGYRKTLAELQDVERTLERISAGELDIEARNNRLADTFGIDPRYMDMEPQNA